MNQSAATRILEKLNRFELLYSDKQLLAEGKLREVVIDMQNRQRRSGRFELILFGSLLLFDIAYVAALIAGRAESYCPKELAIAVNLLLIAVYLSAIGHSLFRKRLFARWDRELDAPEDDSDTRSAERTVSAQNS